MDVQMTNQTDDFWLGYFCTDNTVAANDTMRDAGRTGVCPLGVKHGQWGLVFPVFWVLLPSELHVDAY
jgi:hypothetical protein